ncbi:hypothetical protein ASPBRDRAFT_459016 [Aspergillus brasiliensis CBS 101740]|uniref:Uncharacterized protein n=1 Tax=Aspergillus brasiliensis (strain CBS 101740 / IMI 381727 / IBT 21946) TaxID=767769 RepID=A0A1L9USI8_ASPBC|nr:hypothetical protein ASPBRDRAFT_459016 [Aspergillus brasiliensis CBS 101740]
MHHLWKVVSYIGAAVLHFISRTHSLSYALFLLRRSSQLWYVLGSDYAFSLLTTILFLLLLLIEVSHLLFQSVCRLNPRERDSISPLSYLASSHLIFALRRANSVLCVHLCVCVRACGVCPCILRRGLVGGLFYLTCLFVWLVDLLETLERSIAELLIC